MSTTQNRDMSMDEFTIKDPYGIDCSRLKKLLASPGSFRLVFFKLPPAEILHLKYAMRNCWDKHFGWCSVTISEFIDDLISAIHIGILPLCMEKYENPDILVFDNLQHIAGKAATQEEFYKIIKRRIEQKKTTIIFSQTGLTEMRKEMSDELLQLLSAEYSESV